MTDPKKPRAAERRGFRVAMESALVWRLRQWFGLRLYGIYARDLGGAIADFSPALVGYSHRIFEAPDAEILQALAGAPTLDMSESFMKSAFGKGDACDAVIFAGKLVSYSWMAFTPTRDSGSVFVEFGPRYRYVYKAFTLPEFRGRHAIRQFKVDSDQYCVQRGRVATIAFISIDNQPSIRYALGVGNRRIGHAGYLKFGSVFFSFRTPGVKRAGFRFFERRLG